MTDTGGEPWWVVVAVMDDPGGHEDRQFASTAVDAPTADDAEPEGERVITAGEGRQPERIARVTGPFPNHVPTEERERRPSMCAGCGLNRYCGNHAPTPVQTWWTQPDVDHSGDDTPWECINCETLTWLPPEWSPEVTA